VITNILAVGDKIVMLTNRSARNVIAIGEGNFMVDWVVP
jgi:hypothetical protein